MSQNANVGSGGRKSSYSAPSLKIFGDVMKLTASGTSGQTENQGGQANRRP